MNNESSRARPVERDHRPSRSPDGMSTRTLMAFFGLAFALCWGMASMLLVFAATLVGDGRHARE